MEKELLILVNEILDSIGVDEILELTDSLNLKNDLEIDSITKAELIVMVRNQFKADVSLAETIGDLKKMVGISVT